MKHYMLSAVQNNSRIYGWSLDAPLPLSKKKGVRIPDTPLICNIWPSLRSLSRTCNKISPEDSKYCTVREAEKKWGGGAKRLCH